MATAALHWQLQLSRCLQPLTLAMVWCLWGAALHFRTGLAPARLEGGPILRCCELVRLSLFLAPVAMRRCGSGAARHFRAGIVPAI